MKRTTFKIALLMTVLAAPHLHAADIVDIPGGVKATAGGNEITMQFYTPGTIRVTKLPAGHTADEKSLAVIAEPGSVKTSTSRKNGSVELKSDRLSARLDLKAGAISFYDAKGRLLTREAGNSVFTPMKDADRDSYKARQAFTLDKNEAIYGLGNLENGQLSQRGISRRLEPGNVEDGIPVVVSVKGYGIFWDNYSPTDFNEAGNVMSFESSVGDKTDYYLMTGDNADGVIAEMRDLTGQVPMFPLWTYGFWQSRERYKSQGEITEVVKKHRELGVPLDGIIQDWQYWGNNYLWNAMEFMSPDFNNPEKMMAYIHGDNAHMIISIWSSFGPQTKQYRELNEKGLLFDFSTWPESGISHIWPPRKDYPSGVRAYNPYSKEARDIYWKNLRRLYDFGMDGWWMDSTEPDFYNGTEKDMTAQTGMGTFRKVRGAYPLMTVGGVYDHQRATSDKQRVFILTRSGFAGQQRYGCNVWTGDTQSTWDMLRRSVPAMLNFTMTGNPNTNSDIGGFFAGGYNTPGKPNSAVTNPLFQELYVRWLQMGAFNPMMRSHGTDIMREIYFFGKKGETAYDAIEEAIRLRYALLPYIYSTSWQVTDKGGSFMRPLMMDFPADKNGWNRGDEFLFGDQLLVAPVLEAQYTPEKVSKADENTGWDRKENAAAGESATTIDFLAERQADVYLPAGSEWVDFWTGERLKGGKSITKATTLKTIPLYVKAGGIIPVGPDVQYATEKPWDNLEIRVYPGANGEFTLYEDEFDNYNYEKGAYSTITFNWNDKTRTLTIGERQGEYPGMLTNRSFNINLVKPGDAGVAKSVTYTGKPVSVAF